MSSNMIDAEEAFAYKNEESCPKMAAILEIHPKIIARKHSVSKLLNRDPTKKMIVLRQRIPLPFACRHQFSNEDSDRIFHGMEFKEHDNGEVHLHVELLQDTNDSYESEQAKANYIPASKPTDGDNFSSPYQRNLRSNSNPSTSSYQRNANDDFSEVSTIYDQDEEFSPQSHQESFNSPAAPRPISISRVSNVEHNLPFTSGLRTSFTAAAVNMNMMSMIPRRRVSPRRQARILDGEYLGGASRGDRSVKSAKRSALTQD